MSKLSMHRPLPASFDSVGTRWLVHHDAGVYLQHMRAYLYTDEVQNSLLIGALEAARKDRVRGRLGFCAVTLVHSSNRPAGRSQVLGSCAQFQNSPALVVGFSASDDMFYDFAHVQQTFLAHRTRASSAPGDAADAEFLVPSRMAVHGHKPTELWVKNTEAPRMPVSATVIVRLAVATDAPLLWEGFCENQAAPEHRAHDTARLQAHFQTWLKASLSGGHLYVLCVKANPGVAVSMASFGRATQSTATIAYVYTQPKYRGHKYAAQLTDHLVETASSLQKSSVLVWVDKKNNTAQQLYSKVGFQNKYSFEYI